jgi:hypothetical protein
MPPGSNALIEPDSETGESDQLETLMEVDAVMAHRLMRRR